MGHPTGSQRDDHAEHEHDHDHAEHGVLGRLLHVFRPHSHDASESVDTALESSAEGIRAVKISLVVLGVTAALQGVIVAVTGSVALLADTIHNFSDALTALPLWVAFTIARRPATRRYTYGYGRAEDLAGIFIVAMIALSAALAGWESLLRIADPQPVEHVWVVVAAGLIGFAGNELVAIYRIRIGHKIGSVALVADGLHARTDGFTSLAVVFGALGVLAGYPQADPIIGLVITAAILLVLKGAARDIYHRLMDAIEPELVDAIEQTLLATPGLDAVEEVKARWSGHRIRAEADITVNADLSLTEAHAIATDAHHRLLHQIPKLATATVHVSPNGSAGDQQHALIAHHQTRP
ncbi:MAG TPA: cation diffusion facilitator family transporter [Nocardioidaceae bacterium]|nr:cation diffusion facilitator family transporter [Nocardioidaceae bacterium]